MSASDRRSRSRGPHRERHGRLPHRGRRRGRARLRRGRSDRDGSIDRPSEPGGLPDLPEQAAGRAARRHHGLPRRIRRPRPGGRPRHQGALEVVAEGGHRAPGPRIDRADGPSVDPRPVAIRQPTGARRRPSDRCGPGLRFASASHETRTLAITSSRPAEGKTWIGREPRVRAGGDRERVLLIDADLRKPKVADAFGIVGAVGLTTVLIDAIRCRAPCSPGRVDARDPASGGGAAEPRGAPRVGADEGAPPAGRRRVRPRRDRHRTGPGGGRCHGARPAGGFVLIVADTTRVRRAQLASTIEALERTGAHIWASCSTG